ncbi:histidine kinase [Beutenbergia cavernae DSM 12333]|uniref:histidine kinase n=1 Tax=Beutenbergia cavernae (strain ATCC BAA-8 / DSM 12333 / CCUG 43141 / JCM 11478 / NBRC 16432 / NCIMB 13614 / HKI 0122) TaxID=471853 RepID=C5C2D3_BEUC1|nr:sensor histidine kinase [Beutenbergia cavernae]ACQ79619.1 histidine kinase [Beutenbergia cavernae DSM 12333]
MSTVTPTEPLPRPGTPDAASAAETTTIPPTPAIRLDPRFVDRREELPFLRGPFTRRAWSEFGFLNLALLLAPFALAYALFTVSVLAGLLVTVVGLFVAGGLVIGARGWGATYRSMASSMLGIDVVAPVERRLATGFWRRLRSMLFDGPGWRAVLFLIVTFPLAIAGFVLSWTFLATGLGAMTHWIWSRWLPLQQAGDGTWHRGASFGLDFFIDTPIRQAGLVLVGVLFLLLWPQVQRAFAQLFRLLVVALLGPTLTSLRVRDLEHARGSMADDADARLRRIERDLHDGTQARLVAVAMQLGEAKEQLTTTQTDPELVDLVSNAHASTKEAIAELRELARGIHPPALDAGLAVALETLAARSPLPVTVDVDASAKPAPAVETIAYFCVAELVTNAVKHAGASGVYVLVEQQGTSLRLRVRDDGRGGAAITQPDAKGHRSGLAGLAERVRAVDGTFDVVSPAGGPTVVTVLLPMSVSA